MKVNGERIQSAPLAETISTGISYDLLVQGVVPLFEEHKIRSNLNLTLSEWANMDRSEKAFEVAVSRLKHLELLHENDVISRRMKKAK